MNVLPTEFTRIPVSTLTELVRRIFEKAGMSVEDALATAEILVRSDLRGVFSHGTRHARSYISLLLAGKMNPRPQLGVVHESATTAVIDGDGGLGLLPSLRAAQMATEKAKSMGLGAVVSRNHHHVGASGEYSRVAAAAGCVGFAVSSHYSRMELMSGDITGAGGGSPMSFAFPNGTEPPLVLDMATRFLPKTDEVIERFPSAVFKGLGLGATCRGLASIMAGLPDLHRTRDDLWPAADQGGFVLAIDLQRFIPLEVFKADMDGFIRACRQLDPAPGYSRADLPGNPEWEREREWSRIGIPIGPEHQAALERLAKELGIDSPFE